ncbi:PREDICTED: F-box protein PP2-B10-like [Camelina sativa]|uniref:F-box protein PP2-B10-like n=1 Tax=Camelina sativa TaxID=90675 RepID=A0ABM0ZCY5_CAMSA|nr:PREDICTED: F-box protein PP2-B10-like [Camelina sativa]
MIGGDIVSKSSSPFDYFPEDCISNIISFTNPRDACVAATVSKTFESAAKSDIIWEKFIPAEYESLIPPSRVFSSKKKFYFSLCNDPLLIDDGKKSIWLEKSSGKRCIMLSPLNDFSIAWGDDPRYWQWIPFPESRFEKVAELVFVCWFDFRGRANSGVLSPRTRYSAYIVFKKGDEFYGFTNKAIKAVVGIVGQEPSRRDICFDYDDDVDARFPRGERGMRHLVKPEERNDGWMEIELGEFFNEGGLVNSDDIEMGVLETSRLDGKYGLIIQGIEIRPANIQ